MWQKHVQIWIAVCQYLDNFDTSSNLLLVLQNWVFHNGHCILCIHCYVCIGVCFDCPYISILKKLSTWFTWTKVSLTAVGGFQNTQGVPANVAASLMSSSSSALLFSPLLSSHSHSPFAIWEVISGHWNFSRWMSAYKCISTSWKVYSALEGCL